MTEENKKILDRINKYADKVLDGIDPQKTQVSFQLEKLKPVMEEIAKEMNKPLEEVFILYMDLASEQGIVNERKFQNTVGNMTQYGDVNISD